MNSAKYIRADNFEYHANESWVYGTSNSWLSFKKRIYTRPSALYHYKNQDLTFMINPVLGFSGGKDFSNSISTFQNTRGIEVRGMIDNKVGFYSYLTENQFRFPN